MRARKWSVRNALGYGAIAGALIVGIQAEYLPGAEGAAKLLGNMVGGGLAGSVVFAAAAIVRNAFTLR